MTVWPHEARWWGENGLLLPLDRFSGAGESELNQEFFPTVLNQYRRDGALYALPVDAAPLMLYYDQACPRFLGNSLLIKACRCRTRLGIGTTW